MNKLSSFLKVALLDPFIASFRRFTETILLSFFIMVLTIVRNEFRLRGAIDDIIHSLWLVIILFALATLVAERFSFKRYQRYIAIGVALVLGVVYYFIGHLETVLMIFNLRYFFIIGMVALLALCAPYFHKKGNFSIYTMYIASKLFATIFYAGVLYGSLVAVFAAVESLFNIDFGNMVYLNLLLIAICAVAIPIFLGYIPTKDKEFTNDDFNKIWKSVFSYIIIPITMVFTLILFIYIVTSTFNQNYIPSVFLIATIGVGAIGLFARFALETFLDEAPHLKFFDRYWHFAMSAIMIGYIIELIMQLVEYGFTVGNSIYMYLGIWLIAMLVIRIIRKPIYKMSYGQTMFLSLVDIAFIISLFPGINVINLATYTYNQQLRTVLEKYAMLDDDQIVPRSDLSDAEELEISDLVYELRVIGYQRIRYLPDDFSIDDFESVFGFAYDYGGGSQYLYFNFELEDSLVDLSGLPTHDYLFDFPQWDELFIHEASPTIASSEHTLTLTHESLTLTIDFLPIVTHYIDTLDDSDVVYDLAVMTYSSSTTTADYSLYIRYIYGYYQENPVNVTNLTCSFMLGIDTL